MCGIICEICFSRSPSNLDANIIQRIKNRGPDHVQIKEMYTEHARLFFCGAVLWMQGLQLTPQPVENYQGILLYNGDIFNDSWNDNISDTLKIMNKLGENIDDSRELHIIKEFKLLKGPFSIIYYDKLSQNLYFTRDRIGRSSLLIEKNENCIVISNVLGRNYKCVEVPATHIYILNITTNKIRLHSWSDNTTDEYLIDGLIECFQKQQNVPDEDFSVNSDVVVNLVDEDNVIGHIQSMSRSKESNLGLFSSLLAHPKIKTTVEKLTDLLNRSVEVRLRRQPNKCKECLPHKSVVCSHAAVGILFSGGLDCTILAYLADKYISKIQSIDLINVAFKKDPKGSYSVPDRITGRQSFEELETLCPSRQWNFKEINVSKEELEELKIKTIADLVFPRKTILDESLGSALWFASRGKDENSISPCRVLLLGSGADELFGGYKRHYNAFKRRSWEGLQKELQLDWERIAFRNLARDNRVLCDHGRQPRLPYLDEDLTDYVLQLKPWLKCYPTDELGPGVGDKLLLRLVAFNMGLKDVVTLPKRALQFGSRIANKKEKGSDLSKTFLT